MATYSFLNVQAAISGPGGSFSLGNGAGAAEEGISITMVEDKNSMAIGADGSVMHSLHAGKGCTATVRLQKTSPVNSLLMTMYNFQTLSSANHGRNTISIRDPARGDSITIQQAAFKRAPDLSYAKDGNTVEWAFDGGYRDDILGSGTPAL